MKRTWISKKNASQVTFHGILHNYVLIKISIENIREFSMEEK